MAWSSKNRGTTLPAWLFRDTPALLAFLNGDLDCHRISRGLACPTGLVNTDDKQGLSISELFLLPDQVRDGLLRAILLESIPVSLIGKNAVRHRGLLSAVLLRFELGSTGCYLAATCHTNLERVLDELRQLRTLHALILIAVGQGIYGLDGNGEVTQGNATTLDTFAG